VNVMDECLRVLRMRRSCNRKPLYFYISEGDYHELLREADSRHMWTVTGLAREPTPPAPAHLAVLTVAGLGVISLDPPEGYILCSETRLH
jgi:hypothetical protein